MITTKQLIQKYGKPTLNGEDYLVRIKLPYPMRLAWDLNVKVNRIAVHKNIQDNFLGVFTDLLECYGYDRLVELQIDVLGGTFNFRKMRGGSDFSRHSWGVAIDLDPTRNLLKETNRTAIFARPEYKDMIDIFYKWGFVSLGREKNYDWMHFEIKN